jgi:hypothetical protein
MEVGNAAKSPAEIYSGLRNMILSGSRSKFSLPATSKPTEPWGVVLDLGVQNGTATMVALSDGTASVYLSSGGGFIDGVGQGSIRIAAKNAVRAAADIQPKMRKTQTFSLPETGQAQFLALTDAGIFAVSGSVFELQTGQTPLANLWNALQAVITHYRTFYKDKRKTNKPTVQ